MMVLLRATLLCMVADRFSAALEAMPHVLFVDRTQLGSLDTRLQNLIIIILL